MTANACWPTVRHDVVGVIEVELVDFLLRYELVDLDGARALDGHRLELLGLELDILALAHFVTLDDIGCVDFLFGLRVHLAVFDAVAGRLVDLMEADLLPLAAGRKQRHRTRDEREFQVAFPVRTWGHGAAPVRRKTLPQL
jgi:hypothetical protein